MASWRTESTVELRGVAHQTSTTPSVGFSLTQESPRASRNAGLQDFEAVDQQLERPDGGTTAWGILAAAFVFEGLLFGKHCASLLLARGPNNG